MKKAILLFLLIVGLLVRLYKIDSPLADWHSWRQADTSVVARNFVKNGYDFLHPRLDDISAGPSGKENPEGYRFVEFPLFNAAHALLFQFFNLLKENWLSFETVGRLTSVISSLIGAFFLYLIVKELLGEWLGIFSLGFFLFLPYNIFYSRTVLPGQMMTALTLGSIYFLMRSRILMSLVLAAAAILVKPYAVFILVPSWLVIFGKKHLKVKNKKPFILHTSYFILISLLPFLFWRLWMRQFPEGIPGSQWLLNRAGIRLRPAWWRWLFAERLGKLILGYWGLIPLAIGLVTKLRRNKDILFYSWLFGIFAYLVIFAGGNVHHDYYQMIAVPVLSVFLAKGFWFLLKAPKNYFNKLACYVLLIMSCLFTFGFSWFQVREYYKINHPEIIEAGKAADEILPKEAKVIAQYNGDTAFLYQINRQGWPIITRSLKETIDLGANYYVSVNLNDMTNDLMTKCQVLRKTDQWVIIDLKQCR